VRKTLGFDQLFQLAFSKAQISMVKIGRLIKIEVSLCINIQVSQVALIGIR
jgi:hypothetical protein